MLTRWKALVLEPTVSRPRMVSGNFGAESRSESSDHRRASGQTNWAQPSWPAHPSNWAQPGQRRTLEALWQPDRRRGVPSNLSSWSGGVRWTLSSRSDHSDSTTRATGGVVPASSKHTPSLGQSAYIQFSDLYCMAQAQHCRGFTVGVRADSDVRVVWRRARAPAAPYIHLIYICTATAPRRRRRRARAAARAIDPLQC